MWEPRTKLWRTPMSWGSAKCRHLFLSFLCAMCVCVCVSVLVPWVCMCVCIRAMFTPPCLAHVSCLRCGTENARPPSVPRQLLCICHNRPSEHAWCCHTFSKRTMAVLVPCIITPSSMILFSSYQEVIVWFFAFSDIYKPTLWFYYEVIFNITYKSIFSPIMFY